MGLNKLSPREILVLKRIALEGADIACEFGITLATIEKHRRNIYLKLGVDNRAKAVIKAIQLGLLSPYQFII